MFVLNIADKVPTTKGKSFEEKTTTKKVTQSQVLFYPVTATSSTTFPSTTSSSSNTHHAHHHHPDLTRPSNFRPRHNNVSSLSSLGENGSTDADFVGKCRSEEFHCSSGECIPMTSICDQKPDCFDGSDESSCGK